MLMPTILPYSLSAYQIAENDDQLFEMLVKKPPDLLSFFAASCEDETWCNNHSDFSSKALKWITEQFYLEILPLNSVSDVGNAIREHFHNIEKWLPLNLYIKLANRTVAINSLLFQTASPYWFNFIRTNFFEKGKKSIVYSNISFDDFEILREYAYTGKVKELYRLKETDILRILHLARGSEFQYLEKECEELQLRYITVENLFQYMIASENNSLDLVKKRCCELFNSNYSGVILSSLNSQQLNCELLTSTETSLELFAKLVLHVTHFIAGERVMEDNAAIGLLQRCSKLTSLDLGRTRNYSENILLFSHVKELIFVGCLWLQDLYFKKICTSFPLLQRLDLTSCAQITLTGWGELTKLTRLRSLSLARCEMLSNEEFSLILMSARQLHELRISECRNLSEAAFHALAACQQRFVNLDLGRTSIEDRSLLEITTRITSLSLLDLTRCQNLAEQGIVDAIKVSSLQEVNLSHTN
nr:BTB/POZ domain-containing protein [Parachlamydiaceae bacterium]